MKLFIECQPRCLPYASKEIFKNKEFMLNAIKLDVYNCAYCSDELKKDDEIRDVLLLSFSNNQNNYFGGKIQ